MISDVFLVAHGSTSERLGFFLNQCSRVLTVIDSEANVFCRSWYSLWQRGQASFIIILLLWQHKLRTDRLGPEQQGGVETFEGLRLWWQPKSHLLQLHFFPPWDFWTTTVRPALHFQTSSSSAFRWLEALSSTAALPRRTFCLQSVRNCLTLVTSLQSDIHSFIPLAKPQWTRFALKPLINAVKKTLHISLC